MSTELTRDFPRLSYIFVDEILTFPRSMSTINTHTLFVCVCVRERVFKAFFCLLLKNC